MMYSTDTWVNAIHDPMSFNAISPSLSNEHCIFPTIDTYHHHHVVPFVKTYSNRDTINMAYHSFMLFAHFYSTDCLAYAYYSLCQSSTLVYSGWVRFRCHPHYTQTTEKIFHIVWYWKCRKYE